MKHTRPRSSAAEPKAPRDTAAYQAEAVGDVCAYAATVTDPVHRASLLALARRALGFVTDPGGEIARLVANRQFPLLGALLADDEAGKLEALDQTGLDALACQLRQYADALDRLGLCLDGIQQVASRREVTR